MIRTLVLLALCAFSLCQQVLDQSELYGRNLGTGPFCDSKCIPEGEWRLRRDWIDPDTLDGDSEDAFYWMADGDSTWWSSGCGNWVNDIVFEQQSPFSNPRAPGASTAATRAALEACIPDRIYILKYDIEYVHLEGRLSQATRMMGSYAPSSDNWDDFVDNLYDYLFDRESLYTSPWSLLRVFVEIGTSSVTNTYNSELVLNQTFIANYERNFCSFSGSTVPIASSYTCDFEEDFDSDNVEFITRFFCDYLTTPDTVVATFNDCGASDDADQCNDLQLFGFSPARGTPGRLLKQVSSSVLTNNEVSISVASAEEATEERRRTYDYTTQPINSGFYSGFLKFTYVPYTSSVAAPYCAYKL